MGATFLLLVAGANVTSTGSGLAVPDWPLAFGQWLPEMVGQVLNEHGHRLIAMAVGVLTLTLTVWVLWKEPRTGVRWLAIAALGAVIAQGLLGRWTVLYRLPPAVSIGHAALAEAFFCTTIALAVFLRDEGELFPRGPGRFPLFRWCLAATAAVYVQILLGAVIRHTGSGIPYHISWMVILLVVLGSTVRRILEADDDPARLRVPAVAALGLFVAQLALGMAAATSISSGVDAHKGSGTPFQVWIRNAHLAVGALLLATTFLMTLRSRRIPGKLEGLPPTQSKADEPRKQDTWTPQQAR